MGKMLRRKKKRTRAGKVNIQNKFAMVSITFVVCVLFGILLYSGHRLEGRIQENQTKIDELWSQIADEETRTQEIYDLKEEMQTDDYIASVAQNKLGLVKEDEIIFKPEK